MSTTTSSVYTHLVEYCETDAMKIVHHAEYIKWMEYARHQYMLACGFDWAKLENDYGIMMPILEVTMKYENMTRFGDTIDVYATLEKFNGVYMFFSYAVHDHLTGERKAIGRTKSGFIDKDYRPIILQNVCPTYYERLIIE